MKSKKELGSKQRVQHLFTKEYGFITRNSEINNRIVWVLYDGFNYEYPQPKKNIILCEN